MKKIVFIILSLLLATSTLAQTGAKIRNAPQGQLTESTPPVGTEAFPLQSATNNSYYMTLDDLWDWYVISLGSENFGTGKTAGSVTWSWNTGSGTDASLGIADDSFTFNKKVVATAFETSAADNTHHINVDNSTSYSGTTTGDIYSIAGVPYIYNTSARQIWTSLSLPPASASDINTGTDTSKFVTSDALAGSDLGAQHVCWIIKQSDVVTAVADGKDAFVVPAAMNGMNLTDLTCSVSDLNSASGGSTDIVVRRVRGATAVDMTSTACTISYDAYTASDETVDTSNDDLQTGDKIFVDVNAVTTGAIQKGLSCTATFSKP